MPTTTVFWPADVKQSGYCYGWRSPVLCVAGVMRADSPGEALQALSNLPQGSSLLQSCGSKPVILGTCQFNRHPDTVPSLDFGSLGDYNLVCYYRHATNSLRFYSLDIPRAEAATVDRPDNRRPSIYYAESTQYDFTLPTWPSKDTSLNDIVVNQFNAARTLESIVEGNHKCPWKTLDVFLEGASTSLARPICMLSYFLTLLCNFPISPASSSLLLKDISATIQQIDVRAEQVDFFVNEVGSLHRRESMPIALYSARYTNFFNTVWLILNDITIGFAFGSFLCENHLILSQILNHTVENILVSWVQWVLRWLDSWPAGLKLNTELSQFYSHTFIDLVAAWGGMLRKGAPHLPGIIYTIGIISCGGMTMGISLCMDVLAILTAHIYVCYIVSNAVYRRMLITAGSLWNLFRGKRYNVLRNRTDSWEYDIDQLLFGTILFTLLAFLFPTVLAYYALFAMMRLGTILLQAGMETLLAFMNHFPLFALMLRIKDPWRLPGGIYFSVEARSDSPLLLVKNQPVPLSSIFFQYIRLWSRLASHYNPLRLLRCVFAGEYLAAIPRYSIRYNKTPA